MAQTWTADCYDANHTVATDMANIEQNFATIRSFFSGSSSPASPVGGQPWAHPGNADGLRFRDYANSAWLAVILGDATFKVWLYRNDAAPGMEVDSTVTDRVLAIKGGSAAYNVDGGNTAGSWTITGLSSASDGAHTHTGTTSSAPATLKADGGQANQYVGPHSHTYTTSSNGSHNHTISHNGSCRPAAAVGTLQKPVLS